MGITSALLPELLVTMISAGPKMMQNETKPDPILRSVIKALMRHERSADRLARMVYLIDWRSVLTSGRQSTAHEWRIDIRGPRFRLIEIVASEIRSEKRSFLDTIFPAPINTLPHLDDVAQASIEHVIKEAAHLDRVQLNRLVMSTWPVFTAQAEDADRIADLQAAAAAYRSKIPA